MTGVIIRGGNWDTDTRDVHAQMKDYMRTEPEDSYLQAKKRGLRRNHVLKTSLDL